MDAVDFDEKQLLKSYTYSKWNSVCGRCNDCKEMAEILYPCCNSNIFFEGANYNADEIWDKIDEELRKRAVPDYDAELKDGGL